MSGHCNAATSVENLTENNEGASFSEEVLHVNLEVMGAYHIRLQGGRNLARQISARHT